MRMPPANPTPATATPRSTRRSRRIASLRTRPSRAAILALAVLVTALPLLAACTVPGREDDSGAGATPDATPTVQTTRAALMAIVTATPVVAGNTETSGTPQPPSDIPATYVVQESDSLYAIALRFGVELNVLITANGLSDPNDIQIGQELIIPTPTP